MLNISGGLQELHWQTIISSISLCDSSLTSLEGPGPTGVERAGPGAKAVMLAAVRARGGDHRLPPLCIEGTLSQTDTNPLPSFLRPPVTFWDAFHLSVIVC